ncbi:MAG TPA: trypsin-like peptidase domain-containing protein [Pseudobdellovibrionaceae bacterium]|nr:trypsin-like peptidase domain-containing protein [Pseudobdellovibrionaceae bacterium]
MKTLTTLITILTLSQFSVAAINTITEAQGPSVVCETCNMNSNHALNILKESRNEIVRYSSEGASEITDDRRVAIDRTSEEFKQLNAIGLVTHTKQKFSGTGFMVSPCLMLTNNHVAFDDPDKEIPQIGKEVMFSVGQTGSKNNPFQYIKVKGKVINFNSKYKNASEATSSDWALVKMNKIKDENGTNVNLGNKVGYLEIEQIPQNELLKMNGLITAGFPGEKIKNDLSKAYADLNCKVTSSAGFGQVFHSCQTTPGQSGSPILGKADDGKYYVLSMVSGLVRSSGRTSSNLSVVFESGENYNFESNGDKIISTIDSNKCD